MLDRNHRSHMNCIIEKKKAEEIVDEQPKPLPPLLGINMTTDPRYLHFTGEKMAISCDSGNDHRHPPPLPAASHHHHGGIPLMMDGMMAPPPPRHHHGQPMPIPFGSSGREGSAASAAQTLASAIAAASSSSVPIQIIGPIPLSSHSEPGSLPPQQPSGGPFGGLGLSAQMIPIIVSSQGNALDDLPLTGSQGNAESIFLGPVVAPPQGSSSNPPPPHLHYQSVHYQPQPQHHQHQPPPPQHSTIEAQFPFLTSGAGPSHPFQFSPVGLGPQPPAQSGELRERAVPHPIPIMPRAHAQHGKLLFTLSHA